MAKLLNDNIQEPQYNPFDAPVAGQSLTDEPGNYPWEHPPKTTMIVMMESGIPVEALARILTFTGFAEGEFTPDVGFLVAEPLMKMLAAIGIRAGVDKLVISIEELESKDTTVRDMLTLKEANEKIEEVVGDQAPTQEVSNEGLMSKPEIKEE